MQTSALGELIHDEHFNQPALHERWRWLNPPPEWRIERTGLVLHPAAGTDFWQKTHYGFRVDNGHFLSTEIEGDFSMTTHVRFFPKHQYDQAGLMVRGGPLDWIKTSVEFEPEGSSSLGAVVTNRGFSDWSIQAFPRDRSEVCLRIRKEGADFMIEFAAAEHSEWMLLRVAHLETSAPLLCGLYACSPKGAGFKAEFGFVRIHRLAPSAPS